LEGTGVPVLEWEALAEAEAEESREDGVRFSVYNVTVSLPLEDGGEVTGARM
jgi:hypothetical protein